MRRYLITIVMHDGSFDTCEGIFASDWAAIDAMSTDHFDAKSIRPRRIS